MPDFDPFIINRLGGEFSFCIVFVHLNLVLVGRLHVYQVINVKYIFYFSSLCLLHCIIVKFKDVTCFSSGLYDDQHMSVKKNTVI